MKMCEYCGKEIIPAPYLRGHPSRIAKLRFCNRQCAARSRSKRVELQCPVCKKVFPARRSEPNRRFCSNECYLIDHATTPHVCPTCGKEYVSVSYNKDQIYCSRECVPMIGKNNPNYGKRHPGMFSHSAESRRNLSVGRLGPKNPRWDGGRWGTGKYRMHTWVANWAKENLGTQCAQCGDEEATLHHIVARTLFQHVIMSHFRENLVMLCVTHHAEADKAARVALKANKPHDIPFANSLPKSILDQLTRDGLVLELPRECDFSTLGTAAESMIRPEWYADIA